MEERSLPDRPPVGHHDIITDLAVCRTTQTLIVTSSRDGMVKVWKWPPNIVKCHCPIINPINDPQYHYRQIFPGLVCFFGSGTDLIALLFLLLFLFFLMGWSAQISLRLHRFNWDEIWHECSSNKYAWIFNLMPLSIWRARRHFMHKSAAT